MEESIVERRLGSSSWSGRRGGVCRRCGSGISDSRVRSEVEAAMEVIGMDLCDGCAQELWRTWCGSNEEEEGESVGSKRS